MTVAPTGRAPAGLPAAQVLGFAAALEVLLQCLRALFPLGYHLVGSLGFALTPLVLLAVFLAPLAYPVVRGALGARAPIVLVVALLAARLVLQAAPSLAAAVAAVALGLVAITALLPRVVSGGFGPDALASGTLVGLGLDVALRAWRATDDVVWSAGWGAWLDPSLVVPLLMLAVFAPAFGPGSAAALRERAAPVWTWTILLMPQLLLWTSPAFVGSAAAVPLSVAVAVQIGAVALAMLVLGWQRGRVVWWAPAAVVLLATLGMAWLTGPPVLLLAAAATVAVPLLLRQSAIHAAATARSPWRHAGTATAAWMAMFVLLLLYPMHYELPLPIDNRWLPVIAVVVACLPFLRRSTSPGSTYHYAAPSRLHLPATLLTAAGAVVLAATVHFGVVGGSVLPGPDAGLAAGDPRPGELSVATYNTGQGQHAETGRLAFREVAAAVVGLDADVVALQEVARGWPLTAMADFDAWLRANTDLTIHYTPAADRQFGNALITRIPVTQVRDLDLGQQGGAQRRSAIRAELADGTVVYAMHLQARNSEAGEQSRLDQMQQILHDWAASPATILAGDLNPRNEYADATESPPKIISNLELFLDAGFATTQPTALCTLPTSNDNCSDYLFATPDLNLVAPNAVVEVEVSDHRPVLARIDAG